MGTVYNFFNTPKRQNVLRKAIVEVLPASGSQNLVQVCATRWVDRHESVSVFSSLQDAVVEALDEISSWPEKETSSLSALRQSEFCIVRLVLKKVFDYSVVLCKILQRRSIDLYEAVNTAEDIISEMKSLKTKCRV